MADVFIITGGIGSGKSAAARVFRDLGAEVISADDEGHAVLASDGEAFAAVSERWPGVVNGGTIDRSALATIVFADPVELAALEALTHPAIRSRILSAIAASDAGFVAVETPIPAFLPADWPRVVVDAPYGLRVDRLLGRGMGPGDIKARMAAQPSRGEWLALADLVVDNSGDLTTLAHECHLVWNELLSGA
ncbi:MAG: dephospho-CoA kinase [Acidimicrobiia bacterium]